MLSERCGSWPALYSCSWRWWSTRTSCSWCGGWSKRQWATITRPKARGTRWLQRHQQRQRQRRTGKRLMNYSLLSPCRTIKCRLFGSSENSAAMTPVNEIEETFGKPTINGLGTAGLQTRKNSLLLTTRLTKMRCILVQLDKFFICSGSNFRS